MTAALKKLESELRKRALAYPGAYEETPWGHRVAKVKGKIFLFADVVDGRLRVTTKLPRSGTLALSLPFCEPTGYGLGKSGWVSSTFDDARQVPVDLLVEWLDESYRAVAPKGLVKAMDQGPPPATRAADRRRPKKTPRRGSVLVVGHDALRVERARKELERHGVTVKVATTTPEALAHAARRLGAIVIDLGRQPDEGLELGCSLGRSIPIVYAGVRDAKTTKRAKQSSPSVVACLREAPGDARVVERLISDVLA